MSTTSFPVVRGNMLRVTKLDGCGRPVAGAGNMITTDGFVSVGLSSNITTGDEITVQSASGKNCIRDKAPDTFDGYGVDVTFCEVEPCLFALLTGQTPLTDAAGNVIGFTMNSDRYASTGFALEVWTGSPAGGDQCGAAGTTAQPAGYFVLPNVQGGVLGDFSIENAVITFGVQGAATKDGNNWGQGPYTGAFNTTDPKQNPPDVGPFLDHDLDKNDHLGIAYTTKGFPSDSDGCQNLATLGVPTVHDISTGAAGATDVVSVDAFTFAQAAATPTVTIKRNLGSDGTAATPSNPAVFPTTGKVTVHWGDGTTDDITGTGLTVTKGTAYTKAGTYDLVIENPKGPDVHQKITVT